MAEWQTIDTAPKDGSDILLFCECWEMTFGGIQIGLWSGDYWEVQSDMNLCGEDDDFQPTHWMPLPDPPDAE